MDEQQLRREVRRLRSAFSADEPSEVRNAYLLRPEDGLLRHAGTGAAVIGRMVELPSGLAIPEAAARRPAPIDLIAVYLTASEVVDRSPDKAWVESRLSMLPLEYVLGFLSQIMVRLQKPGMSWREADIEAADAWFVEPARTKVRNLVENGRRLLCPQAVLVLAKMAMRHCSVETRPVGDDGALVPVMLLAVAERLSSPVTGEEARARQLEREIVANQYFNAPGDAAHLAARFVRRWRELPLLDGGDDIEELYADVVGVPLRDVAALALGLWAAAEPGRTKFHPSYYSSTAWTESRVAAVWNVLSADRKALIAALDAEVTELGGAGEEWAFSAFERFPLPRLTDNSVFVLSPAMLLRRAFGWLPFFDVRYGLRERGENKRSARFETRFRRLTEAYGQEALASIGGAGGQRLYTEDDLLRVYGGPGVKVADAAFDYGDAWVVVEISTRQLTRQTAAGVSEEALTHDLEMLLEKAQQIDSTIKLLRDDGARLTSCAPVSGRRFHPVLAISEGFPTNPVTQTKLWDLIKERGLLLGDDVAPVQLVDFVELEIVEAVQETDGRSFRQILDGKPRSGLANSALRDYMIVELGLQPGRARRIEPLWREAFADVLRLFGAPDDDIQDVSQFEE